jgi:hypothetical protein
MLLEFVFLPSTAVSLRPNTNAGADIHRLERNRVNPRLQDQSTTQSVSTSPARLGCHFFDISPPHSLQITTTPVSQLPQAYRQVL